MLKLTSLDIIPDAQNARDKLGDADGRILALRGEYKSIKAFILPPLALKGWRWNGASDLEPLHLSLSTTMLILYQSGKVTQTSGSEHIDINGNYRSIPTYRVDEESTITPSARLVSSFCPLCGRSGDNLAFAFYCSNAVCQNYKP